MNKFLEFWKRDRRYVTLIKAVLLALLPVLCSAVRCAVDQRGIGDVYLPACEWNDELFYFKQVEGMIHYGYPLGYFGFNESHALKLSFAAWSPVLVFPWILWGLLFGWNLLSPIFCNLLLLTGACILFVWLAKPTWKQLGILSLLFCLYTPFSRYILSGMPEIICFSMLIVFYSLAVNYLNRERVWKLVVLFVMAGVMTLMRPYLLLFLLLPAYLWIRRARWKGALGSAAVIAVVLAAYIWTKHYLGAEYFAPLFFTDWAEAFFRQGLFGGIRFTLGKLYYMGKGFWSHLVQGLRTGLASGAYFGGYLVMLLVLAVQCIADGRKLRRLSRIRAAESGEKPAAETAQAAEEKLTVEQQESAIVRVRSRLIIQGHLLFSFIAMLFALLLMYKLTEGSKHLLTFMAAGIFVVSLMETRYFKKAVLLGATFAYLYLYMAVDPYDYQVPFRQEELESQVSEWKDVFAEKLKIDRTGELPGYDNVMIWVFNDQHPDGSYENVAWQLLYGLPEGFGISCCMPDYVMENLEHLQSRYLATLAGGRIDGLCADAGYREIGRDEDLVVYELVRE